MIDSDDVWSCWLIMVEKIKDIPVDNDLCWRNLVVGNDAGLNSPVLNNEPLFCLWQDVIDLRLMVESIMFLNNGVSTITWWLQADTDQW